MTAKENAPTRPTQVYVRHGVEKFLGGLPSLLAEPATSQRLWFIA
jgi:hypothetical protein